MVLSTERVNKRAVFLVLCLVFFAVYSFLACVIEPTGAYRSWTVIFGADAGGNSAMIAHGWGAPTFSHPGLGVLFSVPIRFLSSLIVQVSPMPVEELRATLSLLVVPLFGALGVAVFYLLCEEIGLTRLAAALLAIGFGASFSQLVFASTPDSFGLSGAAIVLQFLLAMRLGDQPGRWAISRYILAGGFLASITITNIVAFGLITLVFAMLSEKRFLVAVGKTVMASVLVLIISSAVFASHLLVYKQPQANGEVVSKLENVASGWLSDRPLERFLAFPEAMATSIVPAAISKQLDENAVKKDDLFKYQLTNERLTSVGASILISGAVVLSLLLALLMASHELVKARAALVFGALLVVLFNWVFHAFWGEQLFLYSQHWQVAYFSILCYLLSKLSKQSLLVLGSGALAISVLNFNALVASITLIKSL